MSHLNANSLYRNSSGSGSKFAAAAFPGSASPASRTPRAKRKVPPSLPYPIIVHSHLSWDWVWQRPQQFHSRLSNRHRILFVETHCSKVAEGGVKLKTVEDYPNLTVAEVHVPAALWHDGPEVDAERLRLVQETLAGPLEGLFDQPVQWFYDPMAAPCFLEQLGEVAVVYDCMDELSKFKGASPELVARERQLLRAADVVFAGGRRMRDAKQRYNQNCHFYGCGVDVEHFASAQRADTRVPDDLAGLSGPCLGYFGVVDERMDYQLLADLADAHPAWNVAIVGPVAKVDPAAFPRRPNLHFLGGKTYGQLPAYAAGFDVCLMPFARNEATEYINPTKALEYMATGRPIVSTDVPDVVSNFSSVVKIARSRPEFVRLCEDQVLRPDAAAIQRGHALAGEQTWEAIIDQLEWHIADVLLGVR
jgi:glycosyltransferase involved in cell wall biosynthesis